MLGDEVWGYYFTMVMAPVATVTVITLFLMFDVYIT